MNKVHFYIYIAKMLICTNINRYIFCFFPMSKETQIETGLFADYTSRRKFIKNSLLTAGAITLGGWSGVEGV